MKKLNKLKGMEAEAIQDMLDNSGDDAKVNDDDSGEENESSNEEDKILESIR